MNMQFITVLAWIFGVSASLLLVARIIGKATYDEIDEFRDMIRGRVAYFPLLWPAVTAVVCWSWILTA